MFPVVRMVLILTTSISLSYLIIILLLTVSLIPILTQRIRRTIGMLTISLLID